MFRSTSRAASGILTINGQLRFSNTVASLSINKTKLKTNGTIVFDQSDEVDICDTDVDHGGNAITWNGGGNILLRNGTVFKNGAASTFSISSNAEFGYANVGAQGTFNNLGVIDKSGGGGTTYFNELTFNNTGTVSGVQWHVQDQRCGAGRRWHAEHRTLGSERGGSAVAGGHGRRE
jgi:hypothetical protein